MSYAGTATDFLPIRIKGHDLTGNVFALRSVFDMTTVYDAIVCPKITDSERCGDETRKVWLEEACAGCHIGGIGVESLHKCGCSHRDVKPQNICFADESLEHVVLIEFGFVQIVTKSNL